MRPIVKRGRCGYGLPSTHLRSARLDPQPLSDPPPAAPSPTLRRDLVGWYAAFVGATALTPWLAVLMVDRGWTGSETSLLLAALPAGRLVGVPFWAWVADRW